MRAMSKDRSLKLDLIGDGVSADSLRQLAVMLGVNERVTWHGAITDDAVTARLAERWEAGVATYESGGYLECADPGKVKLYWQCGVPVIMTRVSHIADKAEKAGAAAVIPYDVDALLGALRDIRTRGDVYALGVKKMRDAYESSAYLDRALGQYALSKAAPFPTVEKNDTGRDDAAGERPAVTVVIPTRDRKAMLLRVMASLYASDYPHDRLEVIVIDNVSSDGTAAAVESAYSDARVLRQKENLWSGGGRAAGEVAAHGAYVLFIDDDNVIDPKCIALLVDAMEENSDLGVAAPRSNFLNPPEKLWCAGANVDWWGRVDYPGANSASTDLPALIDADFFPNAYMVRGPFAKGGLGHNRLRFPHNWNEADYCARVRAAGYRTACVTAAVTHHDINYSGPLTRVGIDKTYDQARSRVRYRRVHMHSALQWLAFFAVVFPYSSLLYLRAFANQKDIPFLGLVGAYLRGTVHGFQGEL
jgi:GT2 family glycosyltransferase